MTHFIIKKLPYDLSSHACLSSCRSTSQAHQLLHYGGPKVPHTRGRGQQRQPRVRHCRLRPRLLVGPVASHLRGDCAKIQTSACRINRETKCEFVGPDLGAMRREGSIWVCALFLSVGWGFAHMMTPDHLAFHSSDEEISHPCLGVCRAFQYSP
jgi:hypothetical protein